MKLLVPPDIASQLVDALRRGGKREIGGVLMAEHVDDGTFRVKQMTVQLKGGTFAAFVRLVECILGPLHMFFSTTNHEYTRFNYIGEWHSHHSFALLPSSRDNATMQEILADAEMGARFVVLLLAKLSEAGKLELGVTVYQPNVVRTVGIVGCE